MKIHALNIKIIYVQNVFLQFLLIHQNMSKCNIHNPLEKKLVTDNNRPPVTCIICKIYCACSGRICTCSTFPHRGHFKLPNSVVRRHMSSQIASAHTNTIAYSALKIACFLVQSRMQIISTNAFEVFSTNWAIQCHIASFELKRSWYIGFRELRIFTGNNEVFKIWKSKIIYSSFSWFIIRILFDRINRTISMTALYYCVSKYMNTEYIIYIHVLPSKARHEIKCKCFWILAFRRCNVNFNVMTCFKWRIRRIC